jgi:hypothetical protein
MKVDDRRLWTEREKNVYMQGQLSILDSLIKSLQTNRSWMLTTFALPLLVETRQNMIEIYHGHFPESDVH